MHHSLRLCAPVVLGAALLTTGSTAHAEIMQTTRSLGPGHVLLSSEVQAQLRPTAPLAVGFHEAIGLFNGLNLNFREAVGVSGQGNYFEAGIKWTFLHARHHRFRPGLALYLGGHYGTGDVTSGADATLQIDFPFRRVRPYAALDANLELSPRTPQPLLGFIAGLRIGIVRHIAWFVEAGVGFVAPPTPYYVSTGPYFASTGPEITL